ncbi:hypothetical protein SAMN02910317_00103 [Ruminococcaceae bacterium FB2012]|nr:hypothetical protein SAMN02910317_00103 [Ruminococcaceae bacterium FB2012]
MKKIAEEDFLIAPDEELREMYKAAKKKQRLLALSMLVTGVLAAVSLFDLITSIIRLGHFSSNTADLVFFFAMTAAFVATSAIYCDTPRKQTVLAVSAITVQVLLYPALLILGTGQGTHDTVVGYVRSAGVPVGTGQLVLQFVMIVLSAGANILGHDVIRELEELKKHPRFPFSNTLSDESYIHRADSESAVRFIENTADGAQVTSVGHEEFLEGEKKAFEVPVPDPAGNLQQHRKIYRPREKSETAYTMDNLKNMYIDDGLQNGELTGPELERLFMEEIRSKKLKDPPSEEFFQQTPMIYRTKKDGSTSIEHREPGSVPAGEKDSRSVLP